MLAARSKPLLLKVLPTRFSKPVDKFFESSTDSTQVHVRGTSLSHGDIRRLLPGTWLNDEVVNGYMALIRATAPAGVLILDSFLFSLISASAEGNNGFERVLAHTKRVSFIVNFLPPVCLDGLIQFNIFDYHRVLFPMHIDDDHWVASEVDLDKRHVCFFDSLHNSNKGKVATWKRVSELYECLDQILMIS